MRVNWKTIVLGSVTIAAVAAASVATGIRGRDPAPPSLHAGSGSAGGVRPVPKPASLQAPSVQDGDLTLRARRSSSGEVVLEGQSPAVTFSSATSERGDVRLVLRDHQDEVTINLSESGIVVSRGAGRCAIAREEITDDTIGRCRGLFDGSSAARAFRRAAARLEERGSSELRYGAVIAGALVAWLDGDPGAVERAASRLAPATGPAVVAASLGGMSCYSEWENEVVDALDDFITCLNETVWILDPLCELQWFLRVESAWFRFLTCSGLPFIE